MKTSDPTLASPAGGTPLAASPTTTSPRSGRAASREPEPIPAPSSPASPRAGRAASPEPKPPPASSSPASPQSGRAASREPNPPPIPSSPASPRSGRAASQRRAKSKSWTILELLRWTTQYFQERGIETARLDAECLLAFALGMERMRLYLDFDKPVTEGERALFRELVGRRGRERVPLAQLVGRKEFWSLPLRVAPGVLAPRPETETLVAAALELLPDRETEARVLDVGTGSGAVALAIAQERPRARISATDISPAALEIARENAEELGMSRRICLLLGSLFEPVAGERFDLVVSNPPYVAESLRGRLPPELSHEPPAALFAGPDGLGLLRPLVRSVGGVLLPGGGVALELSPEQAPRVKDWCRQAGLLDVTVRRDLAGRPRVVTAKGGD